MSNQPKCKLKRSQLYNAIAHKPITGPHRLMIMNINDSNEMRIGLKKYVELNIICDSDDFGK